MPGSAVLVKPGRSSHPAPSTKGHVLHWPRLYDLIAPAGSFGRSTLVDLAAPQAGEHVLDIGCGTGAVAFSLAAREPACRIEGIDASPEMIKRAQKKADAQGSKITFQVALAESLPFPDRSFDLVTSGLMLHHLPDELKQAAFREVRRVLRPQGRLLVLDMATGGHPGIRHLFGHLHGSRDSSYFEKLSTMASDAGLERVQVLPTKHKRFLFFRAMAPGRERTKAK